MRNKWIAGFVCLLTVVTLWTNGMPVSAEAGATDVQTLADGILGYHQDKAGAADIQAWISGGLTAAAALACARAIEQLCGISPRIKWVNDLYLDRRKVCGILCESFGTPRGTAVAIGIGINLTTQSFPPELQSIACSLRTSVDSEALALCICEHLLPYLQSGNNALWLQGYRERFMLTDMPVTCITPQGNFPATVRGIDEDGALIVTLADGTKHILFAGEVSLRAADPNTLSHQI